MTAYSKMICVSLLLLLATLRVTAQIKQAELPPELRAEDSQVRMLLDNVTTAIRTGNPENVTAAINQALTECAARKLRRDCALVRMANSTAQIAAGNFDEAKILLQQSLEIAIDIGDQALQAEFLDGIASLTSVGGDPQRAISIWTDALAKAKAGKSLFIQSQINGSLARQRFFIGELKEAEKNLDEALQIDELNGYALKRLHNVYKAYALLANADKNVETALTLLLDARDASHSAEDWYSEGLAAQAIAAIYARTGKLQEAIAEVTKVSHRNVSPLAYIIDLENMALLFEVAGKQEEAIHKWQELHDLVIPLKNDAIVAEANTHAASLLVQQKHFEDAVSKYKDNLEIAVRRKDNIAIVQVLSSLTTLVQQHPDISSVAPFYERLIDAIHEHSFDNEEGTMLTFSALVQLGNEYKRLKQVDKAEHVFRSAELLDPDSLEKLGDSPTHKQKLIELLHIQHALVLDALHDDLGALLQAYRAFDSATKAQDKEVYDPIVFDINRWLSAEEPYGRLQRLLSKNQPWDALRLSESLFFEESWNSKWREGHADQTKQTFPAVMTSLEGMSSVAVAPALLEGNLYDVPLEFRGLRTFIARQIARLLLFRDNKPRDSERFLQVVLKANGPGFERTVFEAQCWMALAKGSAGEGEPAIEWADKCAASASTLDADAKKYAYTIESYARLSNFAVPSPEAVSAVIKSFGDTPEFRDKLARAYANNSDLRSAISEAEQAFQLFKDKKRYEEAANEALYCSFLTRLLEPKDRTTKYVNLARELFAKSSDTDGAAKAYLEESRLLESKGDTARAITAAKGAQEHSGPQPTATNAHATLWRAQLISRTQLPKAIPLFNQAAEEAAGAKDKPLEVEALIALSDALGEQGKNSEVPSVLKKIEDLTKLNRETLDSYSGAMAAGRFYERIGDLQAALGAYERAELAADKFPVQQGFALNRQAAALEILGDWQGAVVAANKAIDRFKLRKFNSGVVWSLGELVSVYVDRGSDLQDFDKAKALYESALAMDSKARASLGADIIELYLQQGHYSRAISEAQERLKDCDTDAICKANLRISLAEGYIGTGTFDAALEELKKAKGPVQKAGDAYSNARLTYITGKLFLARGQFNEATQQFRAVCDVVSRVGEGSVDLGVGIRANYSYIFDDLLNSLRTEFKSGNSEAPWTALDYADKEASGTFDLRWRRLFVTRLGEQLPPSLRDREREITTRLTNLKRKLAGGTEGGQSILDLQSALSATNRERDDFVNQLRKRAPQYASIAYPKPLVKGDLSLLPGDVLLRIHVAPSATYEWITVPGSSPPDLQFYSFPVDRQRLRALVQEIKTEFDRGRPDLLNNETVRQISRLVLPDEISSVLKSAKRLIYVPDDCLFLVPLEMLLWDGENAPDLAVSYYPSVRDFVSSRSATVGQRTWAKAFVGFADPITADDDPRLVSLKDVTKAETDPAQTRDIARRGISLERIPATGEEVNSIGKLFDSAHQANEVYLGSDATKGRVLHTDLTTFRYIHFATHGLLPGDARIDEPALVLSRDAQTNDVLLGMSEVLGLKLNAELVVLSACNTGTGKLAKGEGVMNLGKAFMSAGSSSVAMSLWQVSDVSTSLLMRAFYKHLLVGTSKPLALALARQELFAAGYTSPFFWAPFILVGD